jgi:hypothetical protein
MVNCFYLNNSLNLVLVIMFHVENFYKFVYRVLSPNSAAEKKFFSNSSIAQVLGIGQSCILFSGIE